MKRIGCLLWHKFTIQGVRPLDPPYDSQYGGADVYFEVPFMVESSSTFAETSNRLKVAIIHRLEMEKLPVGQIEMYIETPPNCVYQIARISMRVLSERSQRRWEFEYKTQEAFNA